MWWLSMSKARILNFALFCWRTPLHGTFCGRDRTRVRDHFFVTVARCPIHLTNSTEFIAGVTRGFTCLGRMFRSILGLVLRHLVLALGQLPLQLDDGLSLLPLPLLPVLIGPLE